MAKEYGLNMWARVSQAASAHTGLFEPGDAGRAWASRALGSSDTWGPEGNPDSVPPKLVYMGNGSPETERVLFAVHVHNDTNLTVSQAQIIVAVGRDRRGQGTRRVASPFVTSSGALATVLGLGETPQSPGPGTFFIGPYSINLPPVVQKGDKLSFEFTMTCILTLSNGEVRSFGYDPELDVDVNN